MRRLRATAGFTVVEMLAALAVVTIMSAMAVTGISAGVRSYERAQFTSQADMLSATANNALSSAFRYMREDAGNDAYVVSYDGTKVSFPRGTSVLAADSDGRFVLAGDGGVRVKLVNDGAYGACQVADIALVSCTMNRVEYSYTVASGAGLQRSYSFVEVPLQNVMRDRSVESGGGEQAGGDEVEPPDTGDLEALIAEAQAALDEGGKSSAATAALTAELARAREVASDASATQARVDDAYRDLQATLLAFENADADWGLDYDAIDAAIAAADNVRPWNSTDEDAVAALKAAYAAAVSARESARTQSALDSARRALEDALAAFLAGGDGMLTNMGTPKVSEAIDEKLAAKTDAIKNDWERERYLWQQNSDKNGKKYYACVWQQCAVVFYDGVYYKSVGPSEVDMVTPLPSSVSSNESNWKSAFSVGDLTDGKSRNYGYGEVHWVAIATA